MRAESPVRFLPHGAFLNFITNGFFGVEQLDRQQGPVLVGHERIG